MAEDYYQLLGVSRGASADEIKKAFRTKAHQHHPDKSTGDADAFKKINEAYQVLSDPGQRQQYDQYGQTFDQAQRQGGGPAGFGGFNQQQWSNVNMDFGDLGDIFGDLFGMGSSRQRSARANRGADIEAVIRIPFRLAAFGGEQTFSYRHYVACSRCNGAGNEPGTKLKTCSTCHGQGQVKRTQQTMLGAMQSVSVCPTCHGRGQTAEKNCSRCHGQGRIEETESITIKIPAGIDTGQRIRLAGKGQAGQYGQPAGDLYVAVEVERHPKFQRADDDIKSFVTIPLSIAALGGTVEVETLDGTVTMKIPAGTASGKIIALRDRGIIHLRGRGRGDQLITIEVEIPSKLSAKQKKLLKELQNEGL